MGIRFYEIISDLFLVIFSIFAGAIKTIDDLLAKEEALKSKYADVGNVDDVKPPECIDNFMIHISLITGMSVMISIHINFNFEFAASLPLISLFKVKEATFCVDWTE